MPDDLLDDRRPRMSRAEVVRQHQAIDSLGWRPPELTVRAGERHPGLCMMVEEMRTELREEYGQTCPQELSTGWRAGQRDPSLPTMTPAPARFTAVETRLGRIETRLGITGSSLAENLRRLPEAP